MNYNYNEHYREPNSTRVPPQYAIEILEKMLPHITFKAYPVGYRISYSATKQSHVYLLRKGVISLYRQPDDILLDIFEASMLRGIIPLHDMSQSVFTFKAITSIEMAIVDRQKFENLLNQLDLWQTFASHLQLVSSMMTEILFKLISPSAFDIVRLQLYELMAKPEYIRETITIESYIKGKSRISRSAIMRILSELKKGGYITAENGILKKINYIPQKY